MSEFYQAKREGKIRFGYDFASASQVLGLWNLESAQIGHSVSFKIPGKKNEIVCLLREDDGIGWKYIPHYGMKCDERGWNEILRIDETNAEENKAKKRVNKELRHPQVRYVFLRQTRLGASWYKFYGVFKLDEQATLGENEPNCIYSRVSEEGACFKGGGEVQNAAEMFDPVVVTEETSASSAEFDVFWEELANWWGTDDGEEILTLEKGNISYTLKCAWNEGTLVVAMISPWAKEWDYVQLYRGMFGWGDIDDGFYDGELRKKVVKLLLDELVRRKKWMWENPAALAEREREIQESVTTEGDGGEKPPSWFTAYRWIRNQMATIGEGDMRLYVKGCNHIWGVPIHCEWAISDMQN